MASFTFETTPAQDALIQALLNANNARRAALEPPLSALTAVEYTKARWLDTLEAMRAVVAADESSLIQRAFENASAVQRTAVKAVLGV